MSETKTTRSKRRGPPGSPILALLGVLLPFAPALGEGIPAYGFQMCESAGIPKEECTLAGGPWPEAEIAEEPAAAFGKRGKSEPLGAYAARRCEQEGIAPEDCIAAPPSERLLAEEVPPAGPFVTPAEDVPRLTATPLPDPIQEPAVAAPTSVILASPPRPVQQQAVRFVPTPPPAAPPAQAFRDVGPPPPGAIIPPPPASAFRTVGPPPTQAFRDVGPPPPGAIIPPPPASAFRTVGPPPTQAFRDVGPPPPGAIIPPPPLPVFRERLAPLPVAEPPVRAFRQPRAPVEPVVRDVRRATVDEDDGPGFFERFFDGRNPCRREVRYSRPPSYRYVECF